MFDVSEANGGQPFDSLSNALGANGSNVPSSYRTGGMSVKFILQLYTVYKTPSSDQPSEGILLESDPAIAVGTKYEASDLSAFATLPTTDAIVYYVSDGAETPTYTIYTVIKNVVAVCKYVQYRYMSTDVTTDVTFVNVANWQGVDETPTLGSQNLITSGGVKHYTNNLQINDTRLVFNEALPYGQYIIFEISNAKAGKYYLNASSSDILEQSLYAQLLNEGEEGIGNPKVLIVIGKDRGSCVLSLPSDCTLMKVKLFVNDSNKRVLNINIYSSESVLVKLDDVHNNKIHLAQGNGTDWSQVITHCWVTNWTGGNNRLCLDFCYKNDSTYGSGIRIALEDENFRAIGIAAYWSGLSKDVDGLQILSPKSIVVDGITYGKIQIEVNWNAIPNEFNTLINPKYYLVPEISIVDEFNIIDSNSTKDAITYLDAFSTLVNIKGTDFQNQGYIDSTGHFVATNSFKCTDFIPINQYCQIQCLNLYIGGTTAPSIIFFDETKNVISYADAQIYPNITNISEIPEGVEFIRCNVYSSDSHYNVSYVKVYISDLSSFVLNEKGAKQIADAAYLLSNHNSQKLTTKLTKVAGLDDGDYYAASYSQYGIGEYTRRQENDYVFNLVLLRQVSFNDSSIDYKAYLYSGSIQGDSECPNGYISENTHTLIKEGTLTKRGVSFQDYEILLEESCFVPKGYQVVIYLKGSSKIAVRGTSGVAPAEGLVCNGQLFSLSQGDDIWTSIWYSGYRQYCAISLALYKAPTFLAIETANELINETISEQVPPLVESIVTPDLEITIPDKVYAVVGTELNLWNDAISLSSDRGLSSPMNYQVGWSCSKGLITDRCFRFNPDASDAGKSYSCVCTLYDIQWKVLSVKTFTIQVLAKNALNSAKNIVYFGDSLGASTAFKLYQDFNGEKFTGTIPTMLGTRGTACKYEAVGGYTWASYATTGPQGYRISVSGVTSLGVNSIYSDGSHVFEVAEVNLVDGIGNALLLRYYTNPGALIMPSGTLTKVSGTGDDTIPYTDAFQESANPLWNDTTQQLDIAQYKEMIGLQQTDKIDAVSFQFGINDHSLGDNLELLMTYIDALYHCFVDDNPNCKFIIGLTTSAGNDFNGSGANYGASWPAISYLKHTYNIRKFYLTLQNSVDYPNIRIAPISLEVDRYYGYAFSERPISQRYSETEKYHNNYVHPGDSGYGQMGDAYFAAYLGVLIES